MKDRKSIPALAMALIMCASLAGCGDNSEKEAVDNGGVSSAAAQADEDNDADGDKAEAIPEDTVDAPDAEGEEEEEEKPELGEFETDADLSRPEYYDYYDDLSKGYNTTIRSIRGDTGLVDSYFYSEERKCDAGMTEDGRIFFTEISPDTGRAVLYCYDTASKKSEIFAEPEGYLKSWCYKDGVVYCFFDNCWIEKYNADGSMENTNIDNNEAFGMEFVGVLDNGGIIVNYHGYKLVSADLKEIVQLPGVSVPIEHGLEQDTDIMEAIVAGNSVLTDIEGTIYLLDTESMTWSELCSGVDLYLSSECKIYGDNLFTGSALYKLTDGHIVSEVNGGDGYFGKNYNTILRDGHWYQLKLPNADCPTAEGTIGQIAALSEPLSEETADSSQIVMLDDTYYILADEYGIFLRTYEKGSAEEETVFLYK